MSKALKTVSAAVLATALSASVIAADQQTKKAAPPAPAPAQAQAPDVSPEQKFAFLPDVVASIGDAKITKKDFIADISSQIPPGALASLPDDKAKDIAHRMVEGMLDKKILLALVEKDGVKPSPALVKEEFDKMVKGLSPEQAKMFNSQLQMQGKTMDAYKEDLSKDKNAQEGLSINRWIETKILPQVKVSDADIEKSYRDNQDKFKTKESVTASHILVSPKTAELPANADAAAKKKAEDAADAAAKKKAEDILAKLKQGEDFGKLAEQYSDCPSGKSAKGSLGEFSQDGQMVKEFEDAAFKLKPGQTSGLVKTQFGYHIIKVTDKKPAGFVALDKVKPVIKENLTAKAVDEKLKAVLAKAKEDMKAKIDF